MYSGDVVSIDSRHYYYLYDSENSLTKRKNSLELEKLSLNTLESIIYTLIKERNIDNQIALNEMYGLQSRYIHRVLNSLYYSHTSRGERIREISQLNIGLYCDYFLEKQKSMYFKVLKRCLINERYVLYDFIRRFIKLLKYNNSKI